MGPVAVAVTDVMRELPPVPPTEEITHARRAEGGRRQRSFRDVARVCAEALMQSAKKRTRAVELDSGVPNTCTLAQALALREDVGAVGVAICARAGGGDARRR